MLISNHSLALFKQTQILSRQKHGFQQGLLHVSMLNPDRNYIHIMVVNSGNAR